MYVAPASLPVKRGGERPCRPMSSLPSSNDSRLRRSVAHPSSLLRPFPFPATEARRFALWLAGDHRAAFIGKSLSVSFHIRAYAVAYEIFRERDRRDDVRNVDDDLLPNCISPHVRIAFGVLSRAVNYARGCNI